MEPQFVRDCRLTVQLLCYWWFTVRLSDFHKVHALDRGPERSALGSSNTNNYIIINRLNVSDVPTEVERREQIQMSSFFDTLTFRSFYPLGADVRPTAWILVHPSA